LAAKGVIAVCLIAGGTQRTACSPLRPGRVEISVAPNAALAVSQARRLTGKSRPQATDLGPGDTRALQVNRL
jgi:hypothetical protein